MGEFFCKNKDEWLPDIPGEKWISVVCAVHLLIAFGPFRYLSQTRNERLVVLNTETRLFILLARRDLNTLNPQTSRS